MLVLILFHRGKDRDACNSDAELRRRFRGNPRRAKLLRMRLDELRAADNLSVMRQLPQANCHELKGSRAGQLAVNLDKGGRLILEPADDPVPLKPDSGLDWTQVTTIRILELAVDYHE